ncbi:adenylate/guanylate cyclase catalytic domain protein [Leptospira inadai serovar Lyme str. 10]|uniref:Adenylate/guanylate cyclase catalytic domain protein n=2 Tax=Leptospira inadai serovar Lyme TaxID=293084 RepID=V6H9G0_9LEPT|nr:adenylate/guanylate cyclase domain-containing protein [Leptospira inadai]EQA35781.1 adenylate/guanylate cyclase catalytic domain protein [Leptospira inadai serovar Lyme str. 10]PNV76939.1 adenylate/guanylate cyclase domain-containing protein [Leptospira inadai serovar Lyme]
MSLKHKTDVQISIFSWFLSLFLIFSLPLIAEETVSASHWKDIDLKRLDWYSLEGFRPEYKNGFEESTNKIRKIESFPVVLNAIYDSAISSGTKEFTLQTRFVLQEDPKQYYFTEPISLFINSIGENWEIFLNGHLLKSEVHLASDGQIERRRTIRELRLPLDSSLLKQGTNRLVFRLIGDAPAVSLPELIAPRNPDLGFYVDGEYSINQNVDFTRKAGVLLNLSLNTIYVFFGLYHLLIFSKRTTDKYNLYFGVFSIAMAVYSLSRSSLSFEVVADTAVITRVEYGSVALLASLFLLFLHDYFYGRALPNLPILMIAGWSFAIFFFSLLAPFRFLMTSLRLWQFSMVPTLLYLLYFIGKAVYLRKKDASLMAISMFVIVFIAVYDILDSVFFQLGIRFTQFAYLLFVISLTTILANRFIELYKQSEDLNIELSHQKLELARQKNAFFRFVPMQFLSVLGKDSAVDVNLGDSALREMSVLFTDIRSFTTISEKMTPEENFRFINGYLASMEPLIQKYDGFVDKFMGDAILALFSAERAVQSPDQWEGKSAADRAVYAAIAMKKRIRELDVEVKGGHLKGVRIGIGINTGNLMLGTVGSSDRLDTTVIGDTVNVASRLESLTSLYKADILITQQTLASLTISDDVAIREVDSVVVKGKSQPIIIYEVYEADDPHIRKLKEATLPLVSRGIILYKVGNFKDSLVNFEQALKVFPEDIVAILYRKRCQEYIETPPLGNWVGVQHLLEK